MHTDTTIFILLINMVVYICNPLRIKENIIPSLKKWHEL